MSLTTLGQYGTNGCSGDATFFCGKFQVLMGMNFFLLMNMEKFMMILMDG